MSIHTRPYIRTCMHTYTHTIRVDPKKKSNKNVHFVQHLDLNIVVMLNVAPLLLYRDLYLVFCVILISFLESFILLLTVFLC